MRKKRIFFRADSNQKIGYGHVIRTLALASILNEVFQCNFVTRYKNKFFESFEDDSFGKVIFLKSERDSFDEFLSLLSEGDIVVLDNYFFNEFHEKVLNEKEVLVVCIDDLNNRSYYSDLILNHSPSAPNLKYDVSSSSKLLLGLDYLLLRPSFYLSKKNRFKKCLNFSNPTLFFCLGGSALTQLNISIIKNIIDLQIPFRQLNVVVGKSTYEDHDFIKFVEKYTNYQINIFSDIDSSKMVNLISHSDIGIVSSGGILFECISLSLPVICGYIADNQRNNFDFVAKNEWVNPVGDLNSSILKKSDFKFDLNKIKKGFAQIDLNSDLRIKAEFITKFYDQSSFMSLRDVNQKDKDLLFDWANDETSRFNSINQSEINYNDHCKWFDKKINENNLNWFILTFLFTTPIGMIRFDYVSKNELLINYSLDKYFRGKGIGKLLLDKGIKQLKNSCLNKKYKIIAYVKHDNYPSIKIFNNLCFKNVGSENIKNVNLIRFELQL